MTRRAGPAPGSNIDTYSTSSNPPNTSLIRTSTTAATNTSGESPMPRPNRFLAVLVVASAIIAACSSSDYTVTPKLTPTVNHVRASRVEATDSALKLTTTAYSDTALTLKRTTALPSDITVSGIIGSNGGTLSIPAAGVVLDIRKNALSAPTLITMTAKKGVNVVYEFGPHGTVFNKPVSIQQDLSFTAAASNAKLRTGMHGAYFDVASDSAYVTTDHIKIKENQIGYDDGIATLTFYVGHFSGYMVAVGFN